MYLEAVPKRNLIKAKCRELCQKCTGGLFTYSAVPSNRLKPQVSFTGPNYKSGAMLPRETYVGFYYSKKDYRYFFSQCVTTNARQTTSAKTMAPVTAAATTTTTAATTTTAVRGLSKDSLRREQVC